MGLLPHVAGPPSLLPAAPNRARSALPQVAGPEGIEDGEELFQWLIR